MTYRSRLRFLLEGIEGVVVLLLVFGTWPVSRHWLRNWGSSPAERDRTWPGDQLVAAAHETSTRALHVAAPPAAVWPWLVQFGLDRAGFYSYELLERAAGIPVKNVESIVAAFQALDVGDEIKLHPKAPGIPVGALKPERYVCFGLADGAPVGASSDPRRSWSIYLEPAPSESCRLILRSCIEPLREPTMLKRVGLGLEQPIDFVMEQRMVRTLRRLAESGGS